MACFVLFLILFFVSLFSKQTKFGVETLMSNLDRLGSVGTKLDNFIELFKISFQYKSACRAKYTEILF